MNPIDNTRDEDRDAWLAQALRHAPDANADAPPALSDRILREARAAVRPATLPTRAEPIGPLPWLAAALSWLARPPVAAGFASMVVATLVGVMWWDQPLDQTLPGAPEVVSSTPQARAETTPPVAGAAAPAAPELRAAPPESVAPKPADASRGAQGRQADKKEAGKSAPTSRPADDRARMLGAADAGPALAAPAPPPAAFPAAPPPQAPQAAAANEAASADRERLERAAPAAKEMAESVARAAADQAVAQRNELRALGGATSPALARARSADTGEALLAALRAQIAQHPERWRWQRGPGTPQPMNPAMQRWLAELERQTASRWQTNAGITPGSVGSLRLFRDGTLQLTLGFGGSSVWAETIGASAPPASVAALPEGVAASLRNALDEAAP